MDKKTITTTTNPKRRKYAAEVVTPVVEPFDFEKARERREYAQSLKEAGWSQYKIADELGVGRSVVLRLLETPEQHARRIATKAAREKRKRAEDPDYAARVRKYRRRYAQQRLYQDREGERSVWRRTPSPSRAGKHRNREVWPVADEDPAE